LQEFFEFRHWPFCIIGGVAALHWGEPRVTRDVDVTLLTGFGTEENFVKELLSHYEPLISDAHGFALQIRVLLLQAQGSIGIDIAVGALPFEESAVKRASKVPITEKISLRLCSPEDLIVFKASPTAMSIGATFKAPSPASVIETSTGITSSVN
jgi:hypothetical protein